MIIVLWKIFNITHNNIINTVIIYCSKLNIQINKIITLDHNISSSDMTILIIIIVYWIIMFMIKCLYNIVITDWNFTQS